MAGEIEVNVLISNIIDQNQFSHCRLCLKSNIEGEFAKFSDIVDYTGCFSFPKVADLLEKLLGPKFCEEVAGIDAVCSECLNKVLNAVNFIDNCEDTNLRLNTILNSINSSLNTDIDIKNKKMMCIVCSEEETQLIIVGNDPTPKKTHKTKCSICKEHFNSLQEVKEHTFSKHGSFTCEKCQYTSTTEAVMVEHEMSTDLFTCVMCSTSRCTEDSLKEHEDSLHSTQVCKECGKSFKGMEKLLAHEQKHSTKRSCPKCGKQYNTKEFYQKHVDLCLAGKVKIHPLRSESNKAYICQDCGKGYSTAGGLRVHQKFTHGNAKPHICNQCGKKFTASSYLKAHLITHTGAKNFKCDICNGKFVTKEALLYHTRRHTGEKPYPCNLCDERFVNSSARADHIKHKHIGPTISCELCPRKFVTNNFLRLHMKKHYDPTNKLYIGRQTIPPNVPGPQNMRGRLMEEVLIDNDYTEY